MSVAKSKLFDGIAQGDALTRLRIKAGKNRTQVAYVINETWGPMESDTYGKYEIGRTELRLSQIRPFAQALNVSSTILCRDLGLLDEQIDIRSALKTMLPDDDAELMEHAVQAFARLNTAQRAEAFDMLADITVRKL